MTEFIANGESGLSVRAKLNGLAQTGALKALSLAATRPVDVAMIGDSNQNKDATGFDHGLGKALAARFPPYASPIYSLSASGPSASQGYASGGAPPGTGATTGAPSEHDDYQLTHTTYQYNAATAIGSTNGVSILDQADGLDVNANLRAHISYGTFDTGSGSFRPAHRRESAPFSPTASGTVVNTNTGVKGRALATYDLAAAARSYDLGFKVQLPGGTASVGPTNFFWMRIENRDRLAGSSVHTLYGEGGMSLYDMAAAIQGYTDARLKNYMADVTYLQRLRGFDPMLVVYINSAPNDRNEASTPSLGPLATGTPTGALAYVDNLRAIQKRMDAMWVALGYDLSSLTYLIVPSHPISDPDDASYILYRTGVTRWAAGNPRVSMIDVSLLTTSAQMVTADDYYSGGDKIHLKQTGYERISGLLVAQIA